ncbi:MAG: hypothetical protein Q9227_005902 [Pyrenula ochraceoflavens]
MVEKELEVTRSDGTVGYLTFYYRQASEDCPICLDQITPGDSRVRHEFCKREFHSRCFLGWVEERDEHYEPYIAEPACPYCRQLLFTSPIIASEETLRQYMESLYRLYELSHRDWGTWYHGSHYLRDPAQSQSPAQLSLPPLKPVLNGKPRHSFRYPPSISLSSHGCDILPLPHFPTYDPTLFDPGPFTWLLSRLANGNSNTHPPDPSDSGWRVMDFFSFGRYHDHQRRIIFFVYVCPQRRPDERAALDAFHTWKAQTARERAIKGPEIPVWNLTDYDEAWLAYFSDRECKRPPFLFKKRKRVPQYDSWSCKWVFGEHMSRLLGGEEDASEDAGADADAEALLLARGGVATTMMMMPRRAYAVTNFTQGEDAVT